MVNNILTPESESPTAQTEEVKYFLIDNYFSELETEAEKGIARENIDVYSKNDVYTIAETDNVVNKTVGETMKEHLSVDDPHYVLPKVLNLIKDHVVSDGTTPFIAPQVGKDPLLPSHLTTKSFVENLLESHVKKTDPHNVMALVKESLKLYVLKTNVYNKSDLYNKELVNKLIKNYIKNDGTTPFVSPLSGVTPINEKHLTTKQYVDTLLFKHEVNSDAHGYLTILNLRLSNYYKTNETYSKKETYSRHLIDLIINTLVIDATKQAIREHINLFDPHEILAEIYKEHYIKRDGSVPFTQAQKGVMGVDDNDLVVMNQLKDLEDKLYKSILNVLSVWVTSGPVQTTVGFVEDETILPQKLTFLDVMDAIFYGKTVDISTEDIAVVGTTVPIKITVRGNALMDKVEVYLDEILLGTFNQEDFTDWSLTIKSNSILKDTTFTVKAYFSNETLLTASAITKVSYGMFVGLVPKVCMPGDLTYDALIELSENSNGAICPENTIIRYKYKFSNPKNPKKITLVVPNNYSLDYMSTVSLHFNEDAFTVQEVPFIILGLDEAVILKVYMYKEALIALNSEITFKLSVNE